MHFVLHCVVVTGLNKWIAVLSLGIVCTFYTTIVSNLLTADFGKPANFFLAAGLSGVDASQSETNWQPRI